MGNWSTEGGKGKDFNEEILKIEGELNEIQAKLTLIKFLWHNLGFTVYLLTGVDY